jgi:hypothetical protein
VVNRVVDADHHRGRAVSTVLDVGLCLVLVSAAVGTLALPVDPAPDAGGGPDAAATAEALATGSVSVAYALDTDGVDAHGRSGTGSPPETERVAHGTYAGLLAEAAVENATLGGQPLSRASDGFERQVVAAVRNTTAGTGDNTRVRAVWTPYPGAPTGGTVTAGPRPPPNAAISAATTTVPNRFPRTRALAINAARTDRYEGVARVLARATVAGWFPPTEVRLALRGDHPVDALVAQRYRRTASSLDTTVAGPVEAVEPRRANGRLTAALARRYAADLRRRFDSPTAAARAVSVGEVRVVVTTW